MSNIKEKKKSFFFSPKGIFVLLLEGVFLSLFIFSVSKLFFWWQENVKSGELSGLAAQSIKTEGGTASVDFAGLKEINQDVVAYLKVEGTKIDYPVVKCSDNDFYLNHSLDKSSNSAGWVFMDFRNKLDGSDKNIIIYGHNRKDGSMFGTLKDVLGQEWQSSEENRILTLTTEKGCESFKVFSVYKIKNEDYYIKTSFKEGEFEKFFSDMLARSAKVFGETENPGQILTLSSCGASGKEKIVLHAKKI